MEKRLIKLFLRLAISIGFLSAVADRFGIWSKEVSVWGNWDNFLAYTKLINPWIPDSLIPTIEILATGAEKEIKTHHNRSSGLLIFDRAISVTWV